MMYYILYVYYSKKVLHHLIFTTFLSNVLYKFTIIFFKYNTAVEDWNHCLTQQYICLEKIVEVCKNAFFW